MSAQSKVATQYRQGDVLLVAVDALPDGLTEEKGPVILAYGEATGHAHQIHSKNAKLFNGAAGRFLKVTKPVVLEHEEHSPVTIPSGLYRLPGQREYSPEAIKVVQD